MNTIKNFGLIIGSAKSGTSSLFNYLSEHPAVAPCRQKEPGFFSEQSIFEKGFKYYQSLWNWNETTHQIALEATPNYTRATHPDLINSAEKIAKIQAEKDIQFKFIYIMRNPIERIKSHYKHIEAWGQEANVQPLANGINDEIIDVSKYAMQIDEYYQRFSAESILLLRLDDLKNYPVDTMRKVCQFLEIDPEYKFTQLDVIHNDHQQRKKVFLPAWGVVRKTKLVRFIARLTPKTAKAAFSSLFARKVNNQVTISAADKTYIVNQLQEDMKQLSSISGIDVSQWL